MPKLVDCCGPVLRPRYIYTPQAALLKGQPAAEFAQFGDGGSFVAQFFASIFHGHRRDGAPDDCRQSWKSEGWYEFMDGHLATSP
jgi:hypothetical protein